MEVIVIGQMDNTIDHTYESANRVYGVGGGKSYHTDLWWWWDSTQDFRSKKDRGYRLLCYGWFRKLRTKTEWGGISKTLKASTHDIAILERICRERNVTQ